MYAERPTNSIASIEADFNFFFFLLWLGPKWVGFPAVVPKPNPGEPPTMHILMQFFFSLMKHTWFNLSAR